MNLTLNEKMMDHSSIDQSYLAMAQNLSNSNNELKPHESRLSDKRLAALERSVFLKGVKVIQKQERIGYIFTVFMSLVIGAVLLAVYQLF
jgi:hypothetical protein